jgi:hypothetical protein
VLDNQAATAAGLKRTSTLKKSFQALVPESVPLSVFSVVEKRFFVKMASARQPACMHPRFPSAYLSRYLFD